MKKSFILITIAAVLLCGCDNGESHNSVIDNSVDLNASSVKETQQTSSTSDNSTASSLETSSTSEEFPFGGMELPDGSLTVGNLAVNAKAWGNNAFFCCDENGEIYFTNLTDNGYLYHLNDGKPEKLAEMAACWITVVGDDIFFISPNGELTSERGYSGPAGAVYRYSKTDKSCDIYLDDNISALNATADGLYYVVKEPPVWEDGESVIPHTLYFRDFQSGTSEQQKMNYWVEAGGYHLEPDAGSKTYIMTNGEVSVDVAADDKMLFVNGCICDKKSYSFFRKNFRILDFTTGEMKVFSTDEFNLIFNTYLTEITGYTVLDGCAYLCFETGHIIKIDKDYKLSPYVCDDSTISLRQLYTDGSSIYGSSGNEIVKITFSDDDTFSVSKLGESE
ncbi:MAG: DUF5050 domain-containing protein [Ruminococcaceae bacterium]|nr:DUF5050 domain-containing protein [Oscillospiraceae bacterium]